MWLDLNERYMTDIKAQKGSSEILSYLFDVLYKTKFIRNISTVGLFADSCGGQNKHFYCVNNAPILVGEKGS